MVVTGLQRLNRKLTREIPQRVYDELRKSMELVADEIVAQMKRHAPVDSGDLQMSISWTWGNVPKGAIVIGRSKPTRAGFKQGSNPHGLRLTIYAGGGDQYYAWFVEFGTQAMLAQPFFFPIWRANRRKALGRVTRAVRKGVKDGAK